MFRNIEPYAALPKQNIDAPLQVGGKDLSADQTTALQELIDWLQPDRQDWARSLQGYAGTGKTTLVQALVKTWGRGKRVAFTAPTNKATKVLRDMAEREGINVDCLTIHKMLALGLGNDDKEKYLIKTGLGEGHVYDYDLVVLDEASMVGDRLFDMVQDAATGFKVPVLFVGDPLQLPPVKDGDPQAFELTGPRLRKIVRQAEGNPIIVATAWVRAQLEGGQVNLPTPQDDDSDGMHLLGDGEFLSRTVDGLIKAYREGRPAKGIAWRNATVDQINRAVRAELYGRDAAAWVVGEKIIAGSPAASRTLYTDCEAEIIDVDEGPNRNYPQYRCYYLKIETEDGGVEVVEVAHPSAASVLSNRLDQLAREAKQAKERGEGGYKWRDFWRLKDSFADLRYSYAITAHRSQGSTYDEVFVDAADIMSNRNGDEALKCLYVAISRASRNVYMKDF